MHYWAYFYDSDRLYFVSIAREGQAESKKRKGGIRVPDNKQHLRLHLDRPLNGRERRELKVLAGDRVAISPVGRIIDIRLVSCEEDIQPPALVRFLVKHEIGFTPNKIMSLRAA
jgi:hypothetical protein